MQLLSMVVAFLSAYFFETSGSRITEETREKIGQFSIVILLMISAAVAQIELKQQSIAQSKNDQSMFESVCTTTINEYGLPIRNCELVLRPGTSVVQQPPDNALGKWLLDTFISTLLDVPAILLGEFLGKRVRRRSLAGQPPVRVNHK